MSEKEQTATAALPMFSPITRRECILSLLVILWCLSRWNPTLLFLREYVTGSPHLIPSCWQDSPEHPSLSAPLFFFAKSDTNRLGCCWSRLNRQLHRVQAKPYTGQQTKQCIHLKGCLFPFHTTWKSRIPLAIPTNSWTVLQVCHTLTST